jgi:hypothetical protein
MSVQVPPGGQDAPQRCTCSNCAVETTWIGEPEPDKLPVNWVQTPDGPACLHCRRELAGDAAVDASDLNLAGRARLRNSTIVEFEVRRAPDRTNSEIANAIHSSVVAVQKARDRIAAIVA